MGSHALCSAPYRDCEGQHVAPPEVDLGAGQSFRDKLGAGQSSSICNRVATYFEFYGKLLFISANENISTLYGK
jgi:hypothetical protein